MSETTNLGGDGGSVRRGIEAQGAPLHVKNIEVVPLRVPLKRRFSGSHYSMDSRAPIITHVTTYEGVVGEVYNGDEGRHQHEIAAIITEELAPLISGQALPAHEHLWALMLNATLDILRDRRLIMMAISAVDSALWDAVGKALGVPLWRLWGGNRQIIPIVAIGGYYVEDPAAIESEMLDYQRLGIAGCKFKVGGAAPEVDASRLRVAREAAGPDFILMADANQGYTLAEAVRLADLVSDLGLRWFEEPVGWINDRQNLLSLSKRCNVPLAAGQSEFSRSGARDLMTAGAIDICNFDASWGGGPTEWLRVAAIAHSLGVEMAHHEEPQIAAPLLGAVPNGTYVECFHPDRDPVFWELIANRGGPKGGKYELSEVPGLGLEFDEAFVSRWRIDR